MALKSCKECGAEISKSAKRCPQCGKKQKHTFLGIVLIIIGVIIIASVFSENKTTNPTSDNKESVVKEEAGKMLTLEKFNKIQTGMTYEEVVSIIGEEGELLSETDIGYKEYATKIYSWYGRGGLGANANFTFQNNKLISKAQFGLE